MIRCRFKQPTDDPRPVNWPIKHPYWISGEGWDYHIVIAYADDEAEILLNWPEAIDLDSEPAVRYNFTSRFPKPEWFEGAEAKEHPVPTTLAGLKSSAWDIKRAKGCKYNEALNEVARSMGFKHYPDAHRQLAEGGVA